MSNKWKEQLTYTVLKQSVWENRAWRRSTYRARVRNSSVETVHPHIKDAAKKVANERRARNLIKNQRK